MIDNPYGCHTMALTPEAKQTMLSQHNARILKLVSPTALDRSFLGQWRAQNPDGTDHLPPLFRRQQSRTT